MGQDMQKGRRTEIEFLNGLVVREGEKIGISCAANAALTDIVKRVERGELKPDPRHITELRLNLAASSLRGHDIPQAFRSGAGSQSAKVSSPPSNECDQSMMQPGTA